MKGKVYLTLKAFVGVCVLFISWQAAVWAGFEELGCTDSYIDTNTGERKKKVVVFYLEFHGEPYKTPLSILAERYKATRKERDWILYNRKVFMSNVENNFFGGNISKNAHYFSKEINHRKLTEGENEILVVKFMNAMRSKDENKLSKIATELIRRPILED